VQECATYKYLGTVVGSSWAVDFKRRRQLAWAVIHEYDAVWRGPKTKEAESAKRSLFSAVVEPVVTYSIHSYPWTHAVERALDGCLQQMLRYCMGERVDHVTFRHRPIEELLGDQPYFSAKIAAQRLQHFGHRLRQHFFAGGGGEVHHPWFDVLLSAPRDSLGCILMRRGGATTESPFSGVLRLLRLGGMRCRSLHEVCDEAAGRGTFDNHRGRWRVVAWRCLRALQRERAEESGRRRERREGGPAWNEGDSRELVRRAVAVAKAYRLGGAERARR
jgi:hypothetical protein